MDDEEKLQSEIDLVSGDETGTSTRGATTGTDEGKGADDSGETDKGGTGTVSGSDGDEDGGGSGSVAGDSGSTGYTLSVYATPAAGASSVTVTKQGESGTTQSVSLKSDTTYVLNATAATGYTFSGWYLDGTQQSANAQYTFTTSSKISGDISYEARFSVTGGSAGSQYTLSITVNPSGSGTVTGAGTYQSNASVTVTATPNEGYSFDGWYTNVGGAASGKPLSFSSTYTFTIKSNTNLIAKFKQGQEYSVLPPSITNYNIYTYVNVPNDIAGSFVMNNMQLNGSNVNFSFLGATALGRTETMLSYMFTYDFESTVNLEEIDFDFDYYANVGGSTIHQGMTSIVNTQAATNQFIK